MARPGLVLRPLAVARQAGLAAGLAAGPASAHVEAEAEGASQGGFAVVAFRVPTESETASTVGLKVQFPAGQPLASVSVKPHPGWTFTITTAKLATAGLGLAARRRPATVEASESVRTGVQ